MEKDKLIKQLQSEGYVGIIEIPDRGLCGVKQFIFTYGLVYGLNEYGYKGRYCYKDLIDCLKALGDWDGIGDPKDAAWIKYKGDYEYLNPLREDELDRCKKGE